METFYNSLSLPTSIEGFQVQVSQILPFLQTLFDDPETTRKAATILTGLLSAHSRRLNEMAWERREKEAANYKAIQRFLENTDDLPTCLYPNI